MADGRKNWGIIGLMLLLLLAALLAGVLIGGVRIEPHDVWNGLIRWLRGEELRGDERIAMLRLPRVLLATLVGMALASSGACLQALFRNPMADPYVLGISAGGALGATVAHFFGIWGFGIWDLGFQFLSPVPLLAFLGAVGAGWVVYQLGRVGGVVRTETLLLSGIALSAMLSAIISLLLTFQPKVVEEVYFWVLGGFWMAGWDKVAQVLPYVLAGLILAALYSRQLNALLMGEEWAHYVGVDVERLKTVILIAATLSCGAAVSVSGIIGFVGLIAPHIVRLLIGPDHRFLIPAAALIGALFLVVCDLAARTLLAPSVPEVPVGIFTALIGVPFFLFLLRRSRRTLW